MSSSFTYTFTKRRTAPLSSTRRSLIPGKRVCSSTMASATVAASTSTSSSLFVSLRSGVGIRTFFAIGFKFKSGAHTCGIFLCCEQALEFTEARLYRPRFAHMTVNCIERFKAVARHAEHGRVRGRNPSRGNQFLGHADGYSAGRFSENAFALGKQFNAFAHFVIGYILSASIGLLHYLERVKPVRRRSYRQRFCNRVWLHWLEEIHACFLSMRNWVAPGGLRTMDV